QEHSGPVRCVAFAVDGRHALSADSVIRLWDTVTGQQVRAFSDPGRGFLGVAFSADGRRAVTSTGAAADPLRLWDVETGKELRRFEGFTDAVWCVDISADGRRVLAGCGGDHVNGTFVGPRGKTLWVWDAESETERHCFGGYAEHVNSVAFSPDGQF